MHAFSVVLFCFSWLFYEQDYLLSFSNVVDDKMYLSYPNEMPELF